jgi:hypothetical protein
MKYLTKTGTTYRRATQQKYHTNLSIPEHIVTFKKERKRASNALVKTTYPGFKYPGILYTKHLTKYRNYVQTGNTSVKITEKIGSILEHMSPGSKDRDFNTR